MLCCRTSAECFVVRTMNKNTQTQIAQSPGANTGGGGDGGREGGRGRVLLIRVCGCVDPFSY